MRVRVRVIMRVRVRVRLRVRIAHRTLHIVGVGTWVLLCNPTFISRMLTRWCWMLYVYGCWQAASESLNITVDTRLADGRHEFKVKAKDGADNEQSEPTTFVWEVDTTAPAVDLFYTPTNDAAAVGDGGGDGSDALVRVTSSDAEFRFRAVGQVGAADGQRFRGHDVKPTFGITVDGTALGGVWCPPGSHVTSVSPPVV
jgi:hypothetical protein